MARSSSRLVDARAWLTTALLIAGCGDELRIDVHYQVVALPAAVAGTCAGTVPRTPPLAPGATKVRFTFRDHGAAGPGPLRCDLVLARGATPVIAVPRRAEPVDVWVEYFADDGSLVARGARANVALTGGGTVTLYAAPPESYACAPAQPVDARAFHSATRLPGGEVLLLGGLIGAPDDDGAAFLPTDGGYVTNSAEIYDPITERAFPVTIPGLTPRGFHEVVVLGRSGDLVQLVVAGGVGVGNNAATAGNVAAISGPIGEAPWRAVTADAALGRAGSVAPPPELLSYSVSTRAFTRAPLAGVTGQLFGGGAVDDVELGQPPIIGGGVGGDTATVLTRGGAVAGTVTSAARVGGTIVPTSAATALWIGGDLADARLYDLIKQLDQPQPAIDPGPAPAPGSNRAFGAAARVGADVLYVGGLAIGAGAIADVTTAPPGLWIAPATMTATALDAPALTPAAYLGAAQLPGGDVLVTGGVTAGRVECLGTLACVSNQSVRIGAATSAAVGTPGLPRYGHRITRLDDGTVLVSGGFTSDRAGTIRAVTTLERFEPHRAVDDPIADLGLARGPGEVALMDGVPLAPCTLVTGGADGGAMFDAEVDALDIDATIR